MPTPEQYRRGMVLLTSRAVAAGQQRLGAPVDELVRDTTDIIAYYSDGTAALAADQYDELRELAAPSTRYRAGVVVDLREEKIRRGVLWAADPLGWSEPDVATARGRLAEVISFEVARPFRDTTVTNLRRDPDGIGWQRLTHPGACRFCEFLAGRGAVYRSDTSARFAAHPNCGCSAVPVFRGQQVGPEASALQYVASRRRRTPAQRARLREALAAMPD